MSTQKLKCDCNFQRLSKTYPCVSFQQFIRRALLLVFMHMDATKLAL